MSPEEVGKTVCNAFDEFSVRQPSDAGWLALQERLLTWFDSLEQSLAFAGMLWVFEHSSRYQHQMLAGELLARRQVPLNMPAQEFIRRVVPRLDASVKEVARYLRDQIGSESAREIVLALTRIERDERALIGLQSLIYHLG